MTTRVYEVNANENRSYTSDDASAVADVAVAWANRGLEPQAYVSIVGELVECRRVEITTRRETARALRSA